MASLVGDDFIDRLEMGRLMLGSNLSSAIDNKWNDPLIKLGRRLMKLSIDLSRLDLRRESTTMVIANGQDFPRKVRTLAEGDGTATKRKKFSKLSDVAMIFIIYMSCKFFVSLCLKNKFNRTCYTLKSIAMKCLENPANLACFSDDILNRVRINCSHLNNFKDLEWRDLEIEWDVLHQEYLSTRVFLKTIGDPFLYLGCFMECIYIFLIIVNIFAYLGGYIVYWKYRGLSLASMRSIFNDQDDLTDVYLMIRRIVNSYISSSSTFLQTSGTSCAPAKLIQYIENLENGNSKKTIDSSLTSLKRELKSKSLDHEKSIEELTRMASDGRLHPINLRPENLRSNAMIYMKFFATALLIMYIMEVGLILILLFVDHIQRDLRIDFENFRDVMLFLEFFLLLALLEILASFYLSVPLIICLDQSSYAEHLVKMVRGCQGKVKDYRKFKVDTEVTYMSRACSAMAPHRGTGLGTTSVVKCFVESEFGERLDLSNHENPEKETDERLNVSRVEGNSPIVAVRMSLRSNLLAALIQSKLFAEQFKGIRGLISLIGLLAFIVLGSVPITVHCYHKYLGENIRSVLSFYAIAFTIYINGSFLPLCDLHSRCIKLVRELAYLLSHSIEAICIGKNATMLESRLDPSSSSSTSIHGEKRVDFSGDYFEDHIVWLLRKELNHPDRLSSQFTVRVAHVRLTYGTIIKVYFWLGILLVPSFFTSSHEGLYSDRLMRFL